MSKARWWAIGVLAFVTVTVVTLDVTGVIFDSSPEVEPPPALQFEPPISPTPVLTPVDVENSANLSARVEKQLQNALDDEALGPRVQAVVTDGLGKPLIAQGDDRAATPASTLKLVTALAVLQNLAPETRIDTAVVSGSTADEVVLVGGGDTTLLVEQGQRRPRDPSLEVLARATARALGEAGEESVEVKYDDSLFSGPEVSPAWEPTYVRTGVIAPVTPLMADQGLVSDDGLARYPDPAAAAADDFAALLADEGIGVRGEVESATARSSATQLARVSSAPVSDLVQQMLRESDNQLAESLGRLAALAAGNPGSFDGAVATMAAAAGAANVDFNKANVFDASGLSREDKLAPAALTQTLALAASDDELRPILSGLPIAGFDGTLVDRFVEPPESAGAGVVRAKTGTLTGVSVEAGMTTTCDGDLVLFAFVADRVPFDTVAARDALDRAAAALSHC